MSYEPETGLLLRGLDKDLRLRLKILAAKADCSLSELIRRACVFYVAAKS